MRFMFPISLILLTQLFSCSFFALLPERPEDLEIRKTMLSQIDSSTINRFIVIKTRDNRSLEGRVHDIRAQARQLIIEEDETEIRREISFHKIRAVYLREERTPSIIRIAPALLIDTVLAFYIWAFASGYHPGME